MSCNIIEYICIYIYGWKYRRDIGCTYLSRVEVKVKIELTIPSEQLSKDIN